MKETQYDIIGDIHGRYDKLAALMAQMGYQREGNGYLPPKGRMALFLGDLIDPKPGWERPGGVRATLHAVKAMVDAGHALCLMGNHELNALFYHTEVNDGEPLREHSEKNIKMHQGTLDDFPDHLELCGEWQTVWLPWFKQLPLYLDLGGLRAVHAAWDPDLIASLNGFSLDDERFFLAASNKENAEGAAVETLLKGVEIDLPEGVTFTDHTGAVRKQMRANWWAQPAPGLRYVDLVFPANPDFPNVEVSPAVMSAIPSYPLAAPPVFFGHYFKPANSPLAPEQQNVACLDHSAAKDGPLVAYRWMGEQTVDPEHYFSVL